MESDTSLASIQAYLRLSERLHSAGQPTAGQLRHFAAESIEVVINLALPTSDDAVGEEAVILSGQGISYCHLPVDWDKPREEDFTLFSDVFSALRNRSLLVHCAKNMRASAFLYLYRVIFDSMSHEAACRDLCRIWTPFDQWYRLINRIRSRHGLPEVDFDRS